MPHATPCAVPELASRAITGRRRVAWLPEELWPPAEVRAFITAEGAHRAMLTRLRRWIEGTG